MVLRDAKEAKTRLLEKPGDLKVKEFHDGKTRLQDYKTTKRRTTQATGPDSGSYAQKKPKEERRWEGGLTWAPREKATIRLLLGFRGDAVP